MQLNAHQIKERDWLITASESGDGWSFHCLPPDGEPLTDNRVYATPDTALTAGKRFVGKAIARGAIGAWIDGLLEAKRIDSSEYATALELIAYLARD